MTRVLRKEAQDIIGKIKEEEGGREVSLYQNFVYEIHETCSLYVNNKNRRLEAQRFREEAMGRQTVGSQEP